ncbi:MAG: serine/threonine-protein kinase [Acidobacteriota bacterium]
MSSEQQPMRLMEVLDQALALRGAKRRRYVERVRRQDPALAEELDELLDTEDELPDDFLNRPVAEEHAETILSPQTGVDGEGTSGRSANPSGAPSGEAELILADPQQIGPYRLLEVLGTGGMGRVYLAEQKEPFERRVALKLIRNGFADETARARFDGERQALARLQHPNIGRILDAGATEDGFPYFALEVVRGTSLVDYSDEHRLTIEERIRLMISVCRGVEHAHRHQIIHRDLKPSNILVTKVDGQPVPKIIDFGIAKSLDVPLTDSAILTGKFLLGAPAYMSPEALNRAEDVDTRTDVYSLGVVLYELLTGQRPYQSGEDSLPRLLRQISEDAPRRPSTAVTTTVDQATRAVIEAGRRATTLELRQRLRGDLDWILLKAIAKEPDARYGSAAALADDLERHLRHEPVAASPPSLPYRLGKLVRRHPAAFTAGVMLVALLMTGLILEGRSRGRAERLAQATQELTREVERIEWLQRVAYLLPAHDMTRDLERIRATMAQIEQRWLGLGWGEGLVHYALGRGGLGLGELTSARRHLEKAWQIGYQRPEVALALGSTLGALYERRLETVERLGDPETRARLRSEAQLELRDTALAMLSRSEGVELEVPELLAARIALYRQELDAAIAKSREVREQNPGLYEARLLEAQALQRQGAAAAAAGELDEADRLLAAAEAAAVAALAVGRSDPHGYLRLCNIRERRLGLAVRYVRPGAKDLHAAAVSACESARAIHPDLEGLDFTEAAVWLDLVDTQVWDLDEDPAPSLDKIEALLAGSLDNPMNRGEAYRMLGQGELLRATYLSRSGKDPRPAMVRAIERLEKAMALEPAYGFVNGLLAQILSQRGYYNANRGGDPKDDYDRAVQFAEAAIANDPDEISGYTQLAHPLIYRAEHKVETGQDPVSDLDRVEAAMQRAAAIDPNRHSVPSILTGAHLTRSFWILKTGGDPTETLHDLIRTADRFLKLNPEAAFGMLMRAQAFIGLARYEALHGRDPRPRAEECRQWYAKGIAKLPRLPGPHVELAELALVEANYLMSEGRSPRERARAAIAHAERALEVDAERADARRAWGEAELILADWQARQGRFDPPAFATALGSLRAAATQEPTDSLNHLTLARLVWRFLLARGDRASQLADLDEPLAPHGIAFATEALRVDPALYEALAVRGALLALAPETRAEGLRQVEAAIEGNGNLAYEWRRWLESQPVPKS